MAQSELIERLTELRQQRGSTSKLARRLEISPQIVHATLAETIPVRWEMACAVWDKFPGLLPELLKYMQRYREDGRRERQRERDGDGDDEP